ncbi:dihydropteroate synthase [Roseivivax marinus]|uniref:dihydropteroate synthase n=1 Tax=Roseivivax marinus TaxID=1379903 RepID=UPI00273F2ADC|nr:dihydropteroate synthase [Roseivivax marinus]
MRDYYRPLVQSGPARPSGALPLAGGPNWFSHVARHRRDAPVEVLPAMAVPDDWHAALTAPRPDVAGLGMDRVRIMGILNVTPDSFSDGGRHDAPDAAVAHAEAMRTAGADMIDIGGESTRPGSAEVPAEEERARTEPVIARLRAAGAPPISIDTRKRAVAEPAVDAGAVLVNDVSGLTFDPGLATFCAGRDLPVCIMHTQGGPETMQQDPHYENVLLDVYDWLAERIAAARDAGIPHARIVVDPGIGFGKTIAHNLALLEGVSLFHGLGAPILVGASRKRFIGTITDAPEADRRMPGSVAVALAVAARGVQILRVHDVAVTRAALSMWHAIDLGDRYGT